jgi:hypothetical protein
MTGTCRGGANGVLATSRDCAMGDTCMYFVPGAYHGPHVARTALICSICAPLPFYRRPNNACCSRGPRSFLLIILLHFEKSLLRFSRAIEELEAFHSGETLYCIRVLSPHCSIWAHRTSYSRLRLLDTSPSFRDDHTVTSPWSAKVVTQLSGWHRHHQRQMDMRTTFHRHPQLPLRSFRMLQICMLDMTLLPKSHSVSWSRSSYSIPAPTSLIHSLLRLSVSLLKPGWKVFSKTTLLRKTSKDSRALTASLPWSLSFRKSHIYW